MNAMLALKLTLVPLLIYLVTLAGRRWGPAVAGWLSAFPIVAGPILFALTLEQGAAFALALGCALVVHVAARRLLARPAILAPAVSEAKA
jgi:hypothetical protein